MWLPVEAWFQIKVNFFAVIVCVTIRVKWEEWEAVWVTIGRSLFFSTWLLQRVESSYWSELWFVILDFFGRTLQEVACVLFSNSLRLISESCDLFKCSFKPNPPPFLSSRLNLSVCGLGIPCWTGHWFWFTDPQSEFLSFLLLERFVIRKGWF